MKLKQLDHARLCLGLTRKELQRRIESGQLDLHVINSQINHYSNELKYESSSEKWLDLKSLDQVDKFKSAE